MWREATRPRGHDTHLALCNDDIGWDAHRPVERVAVERLEPKLARLDNTLLARGTGKDAVVVEEGCVPLRIGATRVPRTGMSAAVAVYQAHARRPCLVSWPMSQSCSSKSAVPSHEYSDRTFRMRRLASFLSTKRVRSPASCVGYRPVWRWSWYVSGMSHSATRLTMDTWSTLQPLGKPAAPPPWPRLMYGA